MYDTKEFVKIHECFLTNFHDTSGIAKKSSSVNEYRYTKKLC